MNYKIAGVIIIILLSKAKFYGQDLRLAGITYLNYPKSTINNAASDQELSIHEFGAFVNIPVRLKNKKTILVNSIGYGFVKSIIYNPPWISEPEKKTRLQAIYYSLILVHKWNEKWSLITNVRATMASDFKEKTNTKALVFQ